MVYTHDSKSCGASLEGSSPSSGTNMESFNLSGEQKETGLTNQDLQDREDFLYLLSIMEKQGAAGITQPSDYEDAIGYKDRLKKFTEKELPEGSVTELFDDIIFDFDGVLYDSLYSTYRALELTLEAEEITHIPKPASINEIANSYYAPYQNYYKRFGISLETKQELESFKDTYHTVETKVENEHHTPPALYPEVRKVLDKIKKAKENNPNLKAHIISAKSESKIREILDNNQLTSYFDEIHGGYQVKDAVIKLIAEKAAVKEKTVMIGDLPSDIKDAQQIPGVKTIAVARGEREKERLGMYLPDYIVTDLDGLLALRSYSKELRDKIWPKQKLSQ